MSAPITPVHRAPFDSWRKSPSFQRANSSNTEHESFRTQCFQRSLDSQNMMNGICLFFRQANAIADRSVLEMMRIRDSLALAAVVAASLPYPSNAVADRAGKSGRSNYELERAQVDSRRMLELMDAFSPGKLTATCPARTRLRGQGSLRAPSLRVFQPQSPGNLPPLKSSLPRATCSFWP